MNVHAPVIIVCSRCQAALAGVTPQYAIVWQREQLTSAQANFADCAAILTSQSLVYDDLPATVIAKLDLPMCPCVPERPLVSRTLLAGASSSPRQSWPIAASVSSRPKGTL